LLQLVQILDIIVIFATVFTLAYLFAPYITKIYTRAPSKLDRFFNPIENFIYKIVGVDPSQAMGWKQYALATLIVNVIQMALAFCIFVFQGSLPLNPQGFPGISWHLAFMQVISFATNTNLQHYNGETTLSYLSQMAAVQFLQFTSAATGFCVAVAMIRGFVAKSKDLGNFYVDFVRSLTRLLIPLCIVSALAFVWLGIPQTLSGYTTVKTVEGAAQTILVGPVASLVSIMQFGTNGGGYYGANSAYPFQNPTPASDVLEIICMLLLPVALTFVFGQMLGKKRESIPVVFGVCAILAVNLTIAFIPNPVSVGADIETRFGGFMSTLWTVVTTSTMTGSLNSALLGMNPLTIVSALMGMFIQGGPGGKGPGLMYMIMYIVITVFIVGLMSGRTPEYLGMKITARDVKLVMTTFLIHPLIILVPTVVAYASGAVSAIGLGTDSVSFTQVLYEYTTAAANNGSDFLGASGNTLFFNISTGIVMFIGRFAPIILLLALAGSMIDRKRAPSEAAIKTDSLVFSVILVASIFILAVLTFFPFLALGPILTYFRGFTNGFG